MSSEEGKTKYVKKNILKKWNKKKESMISFFRCINNFGKRKHKSKENFKDKLIFWIRILIQWNRKV
jgi:hypothetical protein